jgi:hypothetical protein
MKTLKFINPILLAFVVTGAAHAASLNDLIGGGNISSNDVLFDRWSVVFQDSSTGNVPDYNNIDINGSGSNTGLDFNLNGEMNVTGDGIYAFSDLTVGFWASSATGSIADISLGLGDVLLSVVADGSEDLGVFIKEDIYDSFGGVLLASMNVEHSQLDGALIDDPLASKLFAEHDEVYIEKNILVWAANDGDSASLGTFNQTLNQPVPEPSAWVLVIIGLISSSLVHRQFSMRGK